MVYVFWLETEFMLEDLNHNDGNDFMEYISFIKNFFLKLIF